MYAVIRAGGKQYRVAPGDVIRVETLAGTDGKINFGDVLAISGEQGKIARAQADAHVTGEIVGQGRAEKILVFHYKRKKQYKKLRGHLRRATHWIAHISRRSPVLFAHWQMGCRVTP